MTNTADRVHPSAAADGRALAVLPGGTTRAQTAMFPLLPRAVRGNGYLLTGEDGRSWIDVNNNFTALVHGHGHPAVVRAATETVRGGASFGLPTIAEVELAEALVQRTPWAEQVRFCSSGTEAVMAAVRLARATTGRRKLLLQRPAYHGSSDALLPALGMDSLAGVPPGVAEDIVTVPPGDAAALADAVARHAGDLAAVVLDVMPSRAGLRPASPEFVAAARSLTQEAGALLVVDEVVSYRAHVAGMTTGHFGIEPDVLALGKVIGGGFPIGAVLGSAATMRGFDPRLDGFVFHGGTFSGNPVSMRAGLATLDAFGADEVARLNALGDALREQVRDSVEPLGISVTGMGSLMKVVPLSDDVPAGWQARLWWAAEERELLLVPGSMLVCLSTPMDAKVVDRVGERLVDSVRAVAAGG